jgi:hypothetical protein
MVRLKDLVHDLRRHKTQTDAISLTLGPNMIAIRLHLGNAVHIFPSNNALDPERADRHDCARVPPDFRGGSWWRGEQIRCHPRALTKGHAYRAAV